MPPLAELAMEARVSLARLVAVNMLCVLVGGLSCLSCLPYRSVQSSPPMPVLSGNKLSRNGLIYFPPAGSGGEWESHDRACLPNHPRPISKDGTGAGPRLQTCFIRTRR